MVRRPRSALVRPAGSLGDAPGLRRNPVSGRPFQRMVHVYGNSSERSVRRQSLQPSRSNTSYIFTVRNKLFSTILPYQDDRASHAFVGYELERHAVERHCRTGSEQGGAAQLQGERSDPLGSPHGDRILHAVL